MFLGLWLLSNYCSLGSTKMAAIAQECKDILLNTRLHDGCYQYFIFKILGNLLNLLTDSRIVHSAHNSPMQLLRTNVGIKSKRIK